MTPVWMPAECWPATMTLSKSSPSIASSLLPSRPLRAALLEVQVFLIGVVLEGPNQQAGDAGYRRHLADRTERALGRELGGSGAINFDESIFPLLVSQRNDDLAFGLVVPICHVLAHDL